MPNFDLYEDTIAHLIPQICYLHHEHARVMFHRLGLYRGQNHLLRLLWRQDGLTLSALGEAMGVRPATVTKTVQRMEKAGWLERQRDADDARVVRIHLTVAGRAVQGQVEQAERHLEELVLRGLNQEERLLLRRLYLQMRQNLLEALPEGKDEEDEAS
jgi:MarR family transcriptional regulator, organic hydroperoxide resistance regulator